MNLYHFCKEHMGPAGPFEQKGTVSNVMKGKLMRDIAAMFPLGLLASDFVH